MKKSNNIHWIIQILALLCAVTARAAQPERVVDSVQVREFAASCAGKELLDLVAGRDELARGLDAHFYPAFAQRTPLQEVFTELKEEAVATIEDEIVSPLAGVFLANQYNEIRLGQQTRFLPTQVSLLRTRLKQVVNQTGFVAVNRRINVILTQCGLLTP